MKKFTFLEALAHLALFAMSIIWVSFAWHVFLVGSFHKGSRYSKATTAVDGAGAIAMGFIILALAPLTLDFLLKRLGAPRALSIVTAVVLLGSPVAYFLIR